MIVFVESNFILEIAYLQEQHESCEELLALGEKAQIVLKLPAFSVIEAPPICRKESTADNVFAGNLHVRLRSFRDQSHIENFPASLRH